MEEKYMNDILPKLSKIQLFSGFNPDVEEDRKILMQIYENISLKKFKKGNVIIKEGEEGDDFFILNSGSVHISRNTPDGDPIALADLDDSMNIFFGETALISNDVRSATVTALTDCTLFVFSSKKFHALCKKVPVLGYRVLLVLARRMATTIRNTNRDKAMLYQALFNEIAGSER
ncbi:MAG: cyclic nucleotide-binding domain-containing protein [Treponema sp.]|nr:cyclic nucleotide-binding domain-containing protein [Treponema sp.]